MSKPKIGIDARMLRRSTGGIGRYTRELLKAMLPIAPDMEFVIFLTSEDAKEFSSNLPNVQLKITDIPHYSLQEQTKLPGILNAEKLDLVHFLNFNHPLTYKKPFVTTLHDLTLLLFPGHGRKKPNPIRFALFKKVFLDSLHRAEKIIAISQYTAQDAHNRLGIPFEKMDIVLEGGPEPLIFAFNTRNVVTEALQSEAPYFLFVSNWRPHKGLNTLISAFEKFKKETNLPHLLALVGNREAASPSVLEAIENSPYKAEIKQLGFVSDEILPNLFNNSTAFIMPSECEGFGLPILEAYAYGAPVIAADNTSLPEITGPGGLLFPTRDATALAERMKQLAESPELRASLAAAGVEHLQKFSWKQCAEQTLAVYREVLGK